MISIKSIFIFGALAVSLLSLVECSHWKHVEKEHYDSHPQYKFEYSVHDPHTHDIKSQHESRDGDKVSGYYKLKESDGTVRVVHYTADEHSGFKAKVTKDGLPLFDGHQEPIAHSYSISHGGQQYGESNHYGGHQATSTQSQKSKHYHQHKVVLHHHH